MTQSDSSTHSPAVSEAPEPADADAPSERPSVRWAGFEPVRVGWIVDAQRGFLDAAARCRVFGGDGVTEVSTPEAAAALTRTVEWMARWCPVLVYTVARPDAFVIEAIRPPNPLVLVPNADDEQAEDLGYDAGGEGRAVIAQRRPGGGLEEHSSCGALLAAVKEAYHRPVEIVVAGVARDGTLARTVDGLLSHGHRVTVVRDSVFVTGPEAEPRADWAGGGTVVSLAELRNSVEDSRQVSFADFQVAEAYEHLDRLLNGSSNITPLAKLDAAVPWELFRARLEASLRRREDLLRAREPLAFNDALVMFKSILLGAIHGLSDDHLEILLHDRLSFKRFAGLGMTDAPPRARLLRIHRERWAKAGVLAELVADVDRRWDALGYRLQGMRTLMGLSSAPRDADIGQPQLPEPEPLARKVRKRGGGKKRLSRGQRRKRRRKGR